MNDQMNESEGRPVLAGLLALLGVGLAIGLLVGAAALAATSRLGLGGDGGEDGQVSSQQTIYVPKPSVTPEQTGPLVTLQPKPSKSTGDGETEEAPEPENGIALSAALTNVGPGEPIDLSGVYPGGEGAVLAVQRFSGGKWEDFVDVTTKVSNETFSTYVVTSRTGTSRWRMRDTATDDVSNEVRVEIG
ncbi:hypothetical protein [Nocardioides sp.]|uniref:hypothetical protein n=1 Tax=Nocardioides sp. TaxID=35761 RepID=UPI003569F45F